MEFQECKDGSSSESQSTQHIYKMKDENPISISKYDTIPYTFAV